MVSGQSDSLRSVVPAGATLGALLENSLLDRGGLRALQSKDFASRNVALRVRLHLCRSPTSALPDLQIAPESGAMLHLRCQPLASRETMRLTPRCMELLKLLRAARWLTTSQIQRRFFPSASLDAVRKRLRKLTGHGYLTNARRDRMNEALFSVGLEGKRALEIAETDELTLERKLPIQLEHFTAINDLRIAAELAGGLEYFFAAWELPGIGWRHAIIPDGVASFGKDTFAIEFDRGVEGVQFFIRTKMRVYLRGLDGFPLSAVLIVTDRFPRLLSLAKAIGDQYGRVLYATLDSIIGDGFPTRLLDEVSCQALLAGRDLSGTKTNRIKDLDQSKKSLLR